MLPATRFFCALLVIVSVATNPILAAAPKMPAYDGYIRPYVETHNFSGVVLIAEGKKIVFHKAYGAADLQAGRPNTRKTKFHIASMSMQFTAAAVLRLVDQGKLKLDQPVSEIVSGIPKGEAITIRHLLEQRSGLADVNALPEYDAILTRHQTPQSLVEYIRDKPARFEAGGPYKGEEHSAYNVLALLVEKTTGKAFSEAERDLVFAPLHMRGSGSDDDGPLPVAMAKGYAPVASYDLEPAQAIKWSAKTGNAANYTTATDALQWTQALFNGHFVKSETRQAVLDYSEARVGYGWFKSESKRFGVPVYYMNGRAPGYASFLIHIPSHNLTVIVFSNIYVSSTTPMGLDLAAMAMGMPYEPLTLSANPLTENEVKDAVGSYRFGPDFYQPNATLQLVLQGSNVSLRWPDGFMTALVPQGKDRFMDRSYWVPATIQRSPQGRVEALRYDTYTGALAPANEP